MIFYTVGKTLYLTHEVVIEEEGNDTDGKPSDSSQECFPDTLREQADIHSAASSFDIHENLYHSCYSSKEPNQRCYGGKGSQSTKILFQFMHFALGCRGCNLLCFVDTDTHGIYSFSEHVCHRVFRYVGTEPDRLLHLIVIYTLFDIGQKPVVR